MKLSKSVNLALKEQNCPRVIDYSARSKIRRRIIKNLSPKFRDIFEKMIYEYENNLKAFLMDFIFIAGINRSGGSLLARLFDGHKDFVFVSNGSRF